MFVPIKNNLIPKVISMLSLSLIVVACGRSYIPQVCYQHKIDTIADFRKIEELIDNFASSKKLLKSDMSNMTSYTTQKEALLITYTKEVKNMNDVPYQDESIIIKKVMDQSYVMVTISKGHLNNSNICNDFKTLLQKYNTTKINLYNIAVSLIPNGSLY